MASKASLTLSKHPYLLAAAIALVVFLLNLLRIIDFHESDAFDLRLRLRGQQPAHEKIVLLEIDDPSISAVGQWPWPRGIHAVLLDVVAKYNPRLVFFDILFTEQGPDPAQDQSLVESVKNLGNVIMPFFYYSMDPFGAFFPIPPLLDAAKATGFVNVDPDRDGIIRHFRMKIDVDDTTYYHPSVLAMLLQIKDEAKKEEWLASIPRDSKDRVWINYPGRIQSFNRLPFWEVIDAAGSARDAEMRKMLEGSIVIIGQTATGTTDLKATPFTPIEPGVAVQASAMHTFMTGKYLRATPWYFNILFLIALSMIVTWRAQHNALREGALYTLGFFVGYILINLALFLFARIILPLFMPLTVIVFAYVCTLVLKYLESLLNEQVITRELKTAARIQENFLPDAKLDSDLVDVQFECRFIKKVGGDLYDWVNLGDGRFGVCIGDVSGKGVPAALYMAKAISEFRRDNKMDEDPGKINGHLNDRMAQSGQQGMFVTLLYCVIDTKAKTMTYSSGGHDPMVFYHADKKQAEIIDENHGPPLGLFEGNEYESAKLTYKEGDVVVGVTDGIKELRDPKKEEYGMDRLKELVENLAKEGKNSAEIIAGVFENLKEYQRGAEPHDDRTIMCIKF